MFCDLYSVGAVFISVLRGRESSEFHKYFAFQGRIGAFDRHANAMLRFVTNSTQVLVCVFILESLGDEWIIFGHTANASFIQDTQVQD